MYKNDRDFIVFPAMQQSAAPADPEAVVQYLNDNMYLRYNAFTRSLCIHRGSDADRDIRTQRSLVLIQVPDGTTRLHIHVKDALDVCHHEESVGNIYAAEARAILVDSLNRHITYILNAPVTE